MFKIASEEKSLSSSSQKVQPKDRETKRKRKRYHNNGSSSSTLTPQKPSSSPRNLGEKSRNHYLICPSDRMSRKPFLFLLCHLLLLLGFCVDLGQPLKVPFSVDDVLPMLPRQVSWPVLNSFHSAVDLLPVFIGSLTPNSNASLEWKGACFRGNEARLDITPSDRDEPGLGGGLLHLKVGSFLCSSFAI